MKPNKQRRRRRYDFDLHDLNITPMLDMMTILLVFLLKSFASSSENVAVAGVEIPHSTTKLPIEEALTLTISDDAILVDERLVTKLENGRIRAEDLPEGPNGYLIRPLYDSLMSRAEHFQKIAALGGAPFVGRLAVVADKSVSYRILFRVMYTAGRAEFGMFKLFVQRT